MRSLGRHVLPETIAGNEGIELTALRRVLALALLGFVAANDAARRGAQQSMMACHMPGNAADDGALDEAFRVDRLSGRRQWPAPHT